MKITKTINTCRACHHVGHSGSFTYGGARTISEHDNACKIRESKNKFKREYPEYRSECKDKDWKFHWYHRIINHDVIPDWCPLKNGSDY